MQKISIIFVIITLSLTVQAQMKLRNLQTITDTPDEAARNEITKDSTNAPDFVELNNLGVRKALVEKKL